MNNEMDQKMLSEAFAYHSAFFAWMAVLTIEDKEKVSEMIDASDDTWADTFGAGRETILGFDHKLVARRSEEILRAAIDSVRQNGGAVGGAVGAEILEAANANKLGHLMLVQKNVH